MADPSHRLTPAPADDPPGTRWWAASQGILHRDGDAREWTGVVAACHGPVDGRGLGTCTVGVENDVGAEIAGFVTTDCVFGQLEGRFFAASYAAGRLPDGFSFHGYTPEGAPRQTRAADCNLQYRLCLEMRIASPSDHPLRRARRLLAADRNVVLVRVRALPGGLQRAGGRWGLRRSSQRAPSRIPELSGDDRAVQCCGKGRRAPSDEAHSARFCRMYRVGRCPARTIFLGRGSARHSQPAVSAAAVFLDPSMNEWHARGLRTGSRSR